MSINVKTENAKDATVQVHIAFENANPKWMNNPKRRRSTRIPNSASLRTTRKINLSTGRNHAEHKFRGKQKPFYQRRPMLLEHKRSGPA